MLFRSAPDTVEGVKSMLTYWIALSFEKKEKMSANAKQLFMDQFTVESAAIRIKHLLKLQ